MPLTLLPFDPLAEPPARFPARCVMCGAPAHETLPLTAEGKSARRTAYVADLQVPYCADHAAQARRNRRVLVGVFFTAMLLFFAALVLFALPAQLDNADRLGFAIAFAVAAGVLARLTQHLARFMLSNALPGMAATPPPLPVFGRSGSAPGIDARIIATDSLHLAVRIAHPEVAAELAQLNQGEMLEGERL